MKAIATTEASTAVLAEPEVQTVTDTEAAQSVSERVLIMAPVGQDAMAMALLLEAQGLETRVCTDPFECAREVAAGAGALVITEEALELPNAPALLRSLHTEAPWSELPVVILTTGGESRVSRLLDLMGAAARGAMLLERPLSQATLVRSLQVGLSSRRRQYQVRDLLGLQARLAAIVTSSDDAIVSKTLEGIITSWNAGAERMFGYSASEMIGQSILRLIPPELHAEEYGILKRLKAGERIKHCETIRITKDGRRLPVALTISPIRGDDGKVLGASKIARDITERRATEQNLRLAKQTAEAASRAKDKFLAALSHELRTPLTPVLMSAAALREDERLPEDVKAQLNMIERNVMLEARLIDDLLDLSRITHGKLTLRREHCDLNSIIGFVVEFIRNEAREKAIVISLELRARRNCVIGDSVRLQQVFWNLLRNAVKFTPTGGRIRITSDDDVPPTDAPESDGGKVRISVCDNGIGLDPKTIQRIFEPFEQASAGLSSGKSSLGLGLGLAIARAIVKMHQGVIHAESPGPGKGSVFTVELPAEIGPMNKRALSCDRADEEVHPAGSTRPMRLLVVEDDRSTLQVLTRFLTRDGHTVVTSASLDEARAVAANQSFDAVLSDLGLPDGTGLELMKELRDRYQLRGIALSGYGMEEDLRLSHMAGFAAHLVKPVDVQELRRVLRHFGSMIAD
jgi:PAS domain S-box-containing protein